MTIVEELNGYQDLFERSYLQYLTERNPDIHYEIMIRLISRGGKRLRPILCMLAAKLVGGNPDDAIPVAVALEFFHNFTLLHDDIEDGSTLRRGEPTMQLVYGVPLALNSGDGLYAVSYEILLGCKDAFGLERLWKMLSTFNRMNVALVEGQAMDINFRSDDNMNADEVIELLKKKTGALFATSAYCGAIAGGADETVASDLATMWENVGVAFQIQDDILNLTGEEEKYGKKIGDDISEGKPTLMLMHALKEAAENDKELIMASLNKPYDEKKIVDVIGIFEETGAIRHAREVADRYLEDAYSIADGFSGSEERDQMVRLAKYVVEREV
ncbi:MAG: Short chain isoprenyl diphosphate synthase [Candidatus Syntrophoarchaeum sp. GoM_oil]|nr:MAG: Short chain isoprenyl diphosphate synthase [Candidatus Syntrophoarchaeum sp. GoM_oil]